MSEESKNMKHCRRLDRSPEKLSPHLTDENKVVITNLRQSTENIRNYFDKLNNDLQEQGKALDVEKTLRKNAEDKLKSHLVNMYQNKAVNTELRSRLPRSNKSDPFESINSDKKEVDVQTNSVEDCLSLEDRSISGKYKGKARKRNRRRRRLDFEYPYDRSWQRGDHCHSSDTSEEEINKVKGQKPSLYHYNSDTQSGNQSHPFYQQPQQLYNQQQQQQHGFKQPRLMTQDEVPGRHCTTQHEHEVYSSYPQHLSPHPPTVQVSTTLPFHTDTDFPLQSVPVAQSTPFNTHFSSYNDSGFMPSYGAVLSTNTSLASHQKPKFTDGLMHNTNVDAKGVISTAEFNGSGVFTPKDFNLGKARPSLIGTSGKHTPSLPFSTLTGQDNSPASFHTALSESYPPLNKSSDVPTPPLPCNNDQNSNKLPYEQNEETNSLPPNLNHKPNLQDEKDEINKLRMQLKTKTMESEYFQSKAEGIEEIDVAVKNCLDILQKTKDDWRRSQHTTYDSYGGLEMGESDSYYSDLCYELLNNSKFNFLSSREAEEEKEQFLQLYMKKEETKQRITDSEIQVVKSQRDFAVNKMKAMSQELLQFKTKQHVDTLDEGTKMYVSSLQAKLDIYACEKEKLVQENEALKKKVALLQDEGKMWMSKFENNFDDLRIDHSITKYVSGNSTGVDDQEDTRLSSPFKSPHDKQPSQLELKQPTLRSLSSQLPSTIDLHEVHRLMVKLNMAYRIQDQQQKKIESLEKMVTTLKKKDADVERPSRDKE